MKRSLNIFIQKWEIKYILRADATLILILFLYFPPRFCWGHFHEFKNVLVDKLAKLLRKFLVHYSYKRKRLNGYTVFFFLKVNTVFLGIWLTMIRLLIWEFLYLYRFFMSYTGFQEKLWMAHNWKYSMWGEMGF